MFTLVLPCAGRSSRYPNMRPKWSLTHPNGNLMVTQSVAGMDLSIFTSVVVVVLREHAEKYNLTNALKESLGQKLNGQNLSVVLLDNPTSSQSETVSIAIDRCKIEGAIFIKDCDGYFNVEEVEENSICVHSLQDMEEVIPKNKSYVDVDNNGFVKTIVEKRVVGELFCCGGYSFSDAKKFKESYEKISKNITEKEIYVSHVIHQQLLDGEEFKITETKDFVDWGTLGDWNRYKKKYKTLFVDLDGVLVKNSGQYSEPKWGTTDSIKENVEVINRLYNSGKSRIIITTARKSSFKKETIDQLKRLGIMYHNIIFDLLHCERIVINDYSPTNRYPTCRAVNLRRNSDELSSLIGDDD